MAQLIIPGGAQVSLHFIASGQEIVNVLGFRGIGIDPVVLANNVHDAWIATGGPHKLLPAMVNLTRVKATLLDAADSPVYEKGVSVAGGVAAQVGPLSTSAVVRIGAGTRSRSGKGRVFFGPLVASSLNTDGRTITASQVTAIQNAFNQFRTTMDGTGAEWAVLSRKLNTATIVESVSVASVVGTQRRRLR